MKGVSKPEPKKASTLASVLAAKSKSRIVSTGYRDLDEKLHGGFRRSALYDVSGAAGSGKIDLVLQTIMDCVMADERVLWITTGSRFPTQRLRDIYNQNHQKQGELRREFAALCNNVSEISVNSISELIVLLGQFNESNEDEYQMCVIHELSDLIQNLQVDCEKLFLARKLSMEKQKQKTILERQLRESAGEQYAKNMYDVDMIPTLGMTPHTRVQRSIQELMVMLSIFCTKKSKTVITVGSTEAQYKSFTITNDAPVEATGPDSGARTPFKRSVLVPVLNTCGSYYSARLLVYRDWSKEKHHTCPFVVVRGETVKLGT
ncbi:unnamed protein product [Kuraishia capsulata CBS 1993]|uniref:KaiC-like domain-containing protein n=1 Tax=Kuraishia capsulata CBS 1993 TaxID=1382522 RepID=W6MLH3_9ASCO|nr:uncharacterized protein KUCA_T00002940001 [Kuraishia capsulata CBS 1993]CDK26963.1 unnamed protein product [Kuraishia capsulata CBS 1993]